ncbi:endonuclease YncB(thermonuclease family) [Advenella incenata]|uniref:Endonuclease YncB(Thermonuclease family) n=1 Tax=Advenella incenata TaxID=267800 RepID=A0A4Q7V3Q5_9BURK|nr:thermonuclease family protein [Advenella incenata]RZT91066.1 endonuclease YncB(thermonuclease family) [Advenella incenata]
MRNYLVRIGSVLLLVGVVVGAMWVDRTNNTAPLVDAVVERVIDGDTIDVRIDRQLVRIRLVGIDAPELSQDNGASAKQYLASYIQGYSVDIELGNQDKYGRTLGEVYMVTLDPDNKQQSLLSVNELLVRSGHAWAYRYDGDVQDSKYGALETLARSEKRGLWVKAAAVEPWQWRQAQQN